MRLMTPKRAITMKGSPFNAPADSRRAWWRNCLNAVAAPNVGVTGARGRSARGAGNVSASTAFVAALRRRVDREAAVSRRNLEYVKARTSDATPIQMSRFQRNGPAIERTAVFFSATVQ